MDNSFSRIITLLRTERKLTQKQASEALGISQALLSHYERGIRECGLDFLCKAADYYGVSTDYLLGRTAERSGARIVVEDVPEKQDDDGSSAPQLSRKLLANSLTVIYDLLQKADCRDLTSEVSDYLMLAVYKMFRAVYQANPANPRSYFSLSELTARGETSAAMELALSRVEVLSSGHSCCGMSGVADSTVLALSDGVLEERYSGCAASLHNLVRSAETCVSTHE